jgi:hypothetical protein
MSHKTLVNGTVYEVGGGKTLIDGVAFAIDKGKTLVGGTAYEIGFIQPIGITVRLGGTISGSEHFAYISFQEYEYGPIASITSDGIMYRGDPSENDQIGIITDGAFIEISPDAPIINCYVQSKSMMGSSKIKVNGNVVESVTSGSAEYGYMLTGRATITLMVTTSMAGAYSTIEIFEE